MKNVIEGLDRRMNHDSVSSPRQRGHSGRGHREFVPAQLYISA